MTCQHYECSTRRLVSVASDILDHLSSFMSFLGFTILLSTGPTHAIKKKNLHKRQHGYVNTKKKTFFSCPAAKRYKLKLLTKCHKHTDGAAPKARMFEMT